MNQGGGSLLSFASGHADTLSVTGNVGELAAHTQIKAKANQAYCSCDKGKVHNLPCNTVSPHTFASAHRATAMLDVMCREMELAARSVPLLINYFWIWGNKLYHMRYWKQ